MKYNLNDGLILTTVVCFNFSLQALNMSFLLHCKETGIHSTVNMYFSSNVDAQMKFQWHRNTETGFKIL